ncbi:MAG TPA: alpha-amylase family glycosyl hydrolase, partial [Myxococcaceae bacterium]|nr:alpha-amylase family glycosyl hydrolase [Myxococcaceae bacterium]
MWWRTAVLYEVYVRSFQDGNGDGVGDLEGVIERLDHLAGGPDSLGVDGLWLSPFYPSPMADFGYDVSDYCGVHPLFGDLATFDRLIAEAHRRGLRVMIDFVPNHTSDRHPWFEASRRSRHDPKRDWYIWRDGKPDGSPPNNWTSTFGGSSWTWDERTGQYYYHYFLKEQPDLNWRNPEVVKAMHEAMRFWLRRGVDGFRVDAIHVVMEDEALQDNPPRTTPSLHPKGGPEFESQLHVHDVDHDDTQEVVRGLRRTVDAFDHR